MASNPFKFEVDSLQRGLRELELREQHPLKVYRPMPQQLAIHESQASEVIVTGGKRSGKAQPIDEPVLTPDGWRPIGSLCVGDVVVGGDGLPCIVSGVFPQGNKPVYRVGFSDGSWTRCCADHLWTIQSASERLKAKGGSWQVIATKEMVSQWGAVPKPHERPSIPVCSVWMPDREMPIKPYLLGVLLGDGHLGSRSVYFSTADQEIVDSVRSLIPGGLSLRKTKHYGKVTYDYQITGGPHGGSNPLVSAMRLLGLLGKRSWEKYVPDCYMLNKSWARLEVLRGLMDTDGTVGESGATYTTTSPYLAQAVVDLVRSLGGRASAGRWRVKHYTYKGERKPGRPSINVTVRMTNDCPFRLARKAAIWKAWLDGSQDKPNRVLRSITPDGDAECVCISVTCPQSTYVTRDYIVTHNTLATVMEFGSRVLGKPIYRPDGTPIKKRFRPPTPKNPRLYWVIGLDVQHIGQTLYHRLFSPGLGCDFRIIADGSGGWRAYNPNQDEEQYDKTILCPPMFGEHIIEPNSWHMESAAGNIFKSVRLLNGATICAYATTGDHPKQGDAVDGIWLDEDTANAEFLKEWQDRLSTRRGWFLWSVWPKVANEALIKTVERGRKYEDDGVEDPPIKILQLIGSENLYSDKKGVAEMLARMDDDDDEAHRDQGDITAFISGRQMYDFGTNIHVLRPAPDIEKPENPYTVLTKLLSLDKKYPSTWTRYLSIDPSHTRTAVLVGVVPPPEWLGVDMGDRLIIEGELVARKHTPSMLAQALQEALGPVTFEAFVMDQMIGRQTTVGADQTVFAAYEAEFRRRGLVSRLTGSGFMRGCADKSLRRRTVRRLLEPLDGGYPSLLVSNKCPQLIKEFFSYRKKEVKDHQGRAVPMDDPANERVHDCMAALEYLCQYVSERFRDATAYVEPAQARTKGSFAYHSAMAMQKKMQEQEQGGYAHMGPGERA